MRSAENNQGIITEEESAELIRLARKSIEYSVNNKGLYEPLQKEKNVDSRCGAFVTLTIAGNLRGCVGMMDASGPLWKTVRDMAVASANEDNRFNPVTAEELREIEIEISVLSRLARIYDICEIKLGIHGVMIKQGARTGVFLPQVVVENRWNLDEFLGRLCSEKAGLPEKCYLDKKTELYVFTSQIIK